MTLGGGGGASTSGFIVRGGVRRELGASRERGGSSGTRGRGGSSGTRGRGGFRHTRARRFFRQMRARRLLGHTRARGFVRYQRPRVASALEELDTELLEHGLGGVDRARRDGGGSFARDDAAINRLVLLGDLLPRRRQRVRVVAPRGRRQRHHVGEPERQRIVRLRRWDRLGFVVPLQGRLVARRRDRLRLVAARANRVHVARRRRHRLGARFRKRLQLLGDGEPRHVDVGLHHLLDELLHRHRWRQRRAILLGRGEQPGIAVGHHGFGRTNRVTREPEATRHERLAARDRALGVSA